MRQALGPFEGTAITLYRGLFLSLDELARDIVALGPFKRVLEVGAGDGEVCNRLNALLPDAEILGIDIADDPGRMFTGDRDRVSFRQVATGDLVLEQPDPFDLVLLSDILHHVPESERRALLGDVSALAGLGGTVVVKDWVRDRSLSHTLAVVGDKYISGDRNVDFLTRDELRTLLTDALPGRQVRSEFCVPPWHNNVLLVLEPALR